MKKIILAIFILLAFEVFSLNTIIFGGLSTNREVNMEVYSGGVLALESDIEAIDSYDFGIESFIGPSEYLNFGLGLSQRQRFYKYSWWPLLRNRSSL